MLIQKNTLDYQQDGEASMPYLAQYSAVCEDVPVTESWANMITSIAIKDTLNPLNIHFNTCLIEGFLDKIDKAIISMKIILYI